MKVDENMKLVKQETTDARKGDMQDEEPITFDYQIEMDLVNMIAPYHHNKVGGLGSLEMPPYNELKFMKVECRFYRSLKMKFKKEKRI